MSAPALLDRIRALGTRDRGEIVSDDMLTVHRMLTAITALSLLWGAESSYGEGARFSVIGVASVVGFIGSIAVVIGATVAKDSRSVRRLDVALLLLAVIVLSAWVGADILANTAYRTDEEVFVQYGAHLISQGKNPYGVDMTPAFQMFPLPPQQFTPRMDGSYPTDMGYPALPMLLTWVGNLFTGGYHTVVILNVVAAAAAAVFAFFMLPFRYRPLGVLLTVGMPGLVLHVEFGFIQVLMLPFLLAASWGWTNTGRGGRLGRSGMARAVCLGLAVSIQQLAWFTVPFVLVGMYLLRRLELGRRDTILVMIRYAAIAAGTFAVINLPFAVTAPTAWLKGVLEPLTQHAIPLGNGLIGLTEVLQIGSGNIQYYSNGALLLLITLLFAYALYFRVLGPAAFILPFMGLLFSARSLAAYFVPLAVLWGVSLVCADREAFANTPRLFGSRFSLRTRWLLVLGSALPSIVLLGLATTSSAPLKIEITKTNYAAPLHMVQQITVKVTNTTDHPVEPHFLTSSAELFASNFWVPSGGPTTLAAHQTATYVLTGTSQASMGFAADGYKVMAVSENPPAVSWSAPHKPVPLIAHMDAPPGNAAVAPGTQVVLRVQLSSTTSGEAIHRGGVRIALSQTQYKAGITPGPATINGVPHPDPAYAITNSDGVATFTVSCDTAQSLPVVFQAWVTNESLSYSGLVPITWQ